MRKHSGKALILFQFAAEKGHDIAMWYMGNIYYYGNGVTENVARAKEWYRKAAEAVNKDAKAKFQNGIYNIMNFGTEIDYREQVKPFMEEYSKTFETLYKKTGLLRIKIIDTGRVLIDKVTPKASKLHKFLYWRNAVPKEVTKMLKKVAK